jgi:hypothetical protein
MYQNAQRVCLDRFDKCDRLCKGSSEQNTEHSWKHFAEDIVLFSIIKMYQRVNDNLVLELLLYILDFVAMSKDTELLPLHTFETRCNAWNT